MQIHNLSETNSVLNSFTSQIRNVAIQNDRLRFRRNIERIGEILSYEMSKTFPFENQNITTPLGDKSIAVASNEVVICSILRAGLPLHIGVMNYLDSAESAFISAYRKHKANSVDFEIKIEYVACPNLENKTLVLVDPMLATGQSLVNTYNAITKFGHPCTLHIVSVIGAKEGVAYVGKNLPESTHLWIADIDATLNDKGYIVPGLGDAGDLAFGEKLQK